MSSGSSGRSRASSRSSSGSSSTPPTATPPEEPGLFIRRKRGRPEHVDGEERQHAVHSLFSYSSATNISRCSIDACKNPDVTGKHAGNLMKHLHSHHFAIHKNVQDEMDKRRGNTTSPPAKRRCLNGVNMSGPALQLNCVRLVSECGMAFRLLDYPAFQDIVSPMINAMPVAERVTISSRATPPKITEFAERIRQKIIKEVDAKMISLKVDGASKNHRHFVGINIIYCVNDRPTTRTLAIEELLVEASGANLKALITMVLKKFKIEPRQLVSFTSDSGANYNKAGKLLMGEAAAEDDDDTEDCLDPDADSTWLHTDIQMTQDDFTLQSVRCAAHTLELAIHDAFSTEKDAKPTIAAVRKLAKYLLQDTKVRQLKDARLPLPKLDVCTRWGSTYDLLQSVVRLKNFVKFSLQWSKPNDQHDNGLSDEQWEQVDRQLDDLRPVRKATILLQKEDLTLGEFYAIWSGVVLKLEKRKESSTLAESLLKFMDRRSKAVPYRDRRRGERLAPLFNYPSFNAAVFLDPRFMSLLTPEQVQEAKSYLCDLYDRMEVVRGPPVQEVEDQEDVDSPDDFSADDDSDEDAATLFRKVLESKNRERRAAQGMPVTGNSSSRAGLRAMLDDYDRTTSPLPNAANIFDFWAKKKLLCPEIYALAVVVLCIPATQVSVERLFSALRYILRPQRYGLKAEHIDNIAFLNANSKLVQALVDELGVSSSGSSRSRTAAVSENTVSNS